ncbi:MAG: cell division protein ZipA C-terminal FtsZ-binding domain-containing protein [Gammaproteobacteria bacterium]|nr:cell division protein ZipA C-terminal FtsZ-binding domain-containing protein [Gammaproteobacteria bacterium]
MDTLRMVLLIVGVLLVGGLLFFEITREKPRHHRSLFDRLTRRKKERPEGSVVASSPSHLFADDEMLESLRQINKKGVEDLDPLEKVSSSRNGERELEPTVIYISLLAVDGSGFSGDLLYQQLGMNGFVYGDMGIFHRVGMDGKPLISIANLHEPGTFDLDTITEERFGGFWLFIQLPLAQGGSEVLEELLDVATRLGEVLGGQLCDSQQQPLAQQEITRMRHQAALFD